MTITVTAGELSDRWLWEEACEILGIDEYALAEGLMDSSEELTFTEAQARKIGLL